MALHDKSAVQPANLLTCYVRPHGYHAYIAGSIPNDLRSLDRLYLQRELCRFLIESRPADAELDCLDVELHHQRIDGKAQFGDCDLFA